jgi:hypothetical protein
VPLPVPLAPLVIVSQAALLDAVQAHPAPLVTPTVPVLAAAPTEAEVEPRLKLHAAAWVTVIVLPAIVRVPLRVEVAVFAAIANAVVPLPVPDAPLVMVSHAALDAAVHGQPLPAVTDTEAEPAVAAAETLAGETDGLHAASCVTVSVMPAIVIVPVRGDVLVFAAIE